jgi:hypothetical protein
MPTRAHRFFARNWLPGIWMTAFPTLAVLLMASALAPAPELAGLGPDAKAYILLIGIALALGLCIAALLGPFVLGPVYHWRAEVNGAPFQPGDRVEILVGANRGRVARVAEVWDWRGSLRVEFAEPVPRKDKTIFALTQVLRISAAESPAESTPPRATDCTQSNARIRNPR